MALVSLQNISLAFGGPLIFDQLNLQIEKKERIVLLGRNGVGKTTLMKLIAKENQVSSGKVLYQKDIKATYLPQEIPTNLTGNIFDIVLSGLGEKAKLVRDYHHLNQQLHTNSSPEILKKLDHLQTQMDNENGWEIDHEIERVIIQMKLNKNSNFEELSGGQKKRVLLAKALVINPHLLLLDEPTNHLDIDSIQWLEHFLKNYEGTLFFVTHDRTFMQNLATRIIELDRGKLSSWECDYPTFLKRRQETFDVEATQKDLFNKKLAQEEAWIRKGIKARRTRNEGRVRALEKMREEKKQQRQALGKVNITSQEADRSGRVVIKADNIGFSYQDLPIANNFSTQIMRGDKIGLIGPNGSGKTTLIKLLLGKVSPHKGSIKLGTNLQISYYDQLRETLDENKTVAENICGSGDSVTINGKKRHILGYLQDFLFSPERARTPIKVLSGGERNRLFLARLFTKPSNLLIMDEPTNDLDIETLELLEERLLEYSGTLILVSHDRAFLNNVVTSTIALEGNGNINEYPGGYDDWLKQSHHHEKTMPQKKPSSEKKYKPKSPQTKKLTFKEQQELSKLPARIEKLEKEQEQINQLMMESSFYQKPSEEISKTTKQLEELTIKIQEAYNRWEQLSEIEEK